MYIYIYYMVEIFFSFLNTTTFHSPPPARAPALSEKKAGGNRVLEEPNSQSSGDTRTLCFTKQHVRPRWELKQHWDSGRRTENSILRQLHKESKVVCTSRSH